MALRRNTKPVDGTIPIQALLYPDEILLARQEDVGIYSGQQKAPNHQTGTIHVTSHRLFYIDTRKPYKYSFELDLLKIVQTDYYAGLFTSSAKVTLHLSAPDPTTSTQSGSSVGFQALGASEPGFDSWTCGVCDYRNPPGLSPAAAKICGLCGVPRSAMPESISNGTPSSHHLSKSLPSSMSHLSISASAPESTTSQDSSDTISCPACTFLNHQALRQCEMCGTDLPRPVIRSTMRSAPTSRPESPDEDEDDTVTNRILKVSFRKGGDKPFYALLKRSLQSKAWEVKSRSTTRLNEQGRATGTPGISGILRNVEATVQGQHDSISDALQDLDALMIKAKDMVRLAAELNERLTAVSAPSSGDASSNVMSTTATEPEEATFIRSSLSQLGLQMSNAPVTLDMIKDEKKWFEELAKELAQILQGNGIPRSDSRPGLMKERGIIALDEVWGGWNRARGVALIPPQTLLQVVPHLPFFTSPPINTRLLSSGLRVLHTPQYTHQAFSARLVATMKTEGPKTALDVSKSEGLTIGMAVEMISAVENDGSICRDEVGDEQSGTGVGDGGRVVQWWWNVFEGYTWDGQEEQ